MADNLTILSTVGEPAETPPARRTLRPAVRASGDPLGDVARLPSLDPDALRLGATLGEGGMGVVRVGVQTSIGREVAVKMLRPDRDDPVARRRILEEALVTGHLEHPNVVPVYDVGRDPDGRPFLVMKRVEGEPWSASLRDASRIDDPDPLAWHVRTLVTVCRAVAFAHARGVVHRDLKPDNVLLGAFGEVYLADWGLAAALPGAFPGTRPPGLPSAAAPNGVAGTPAYLSPEQARGEATSAATDVWLLGAILYELAHGEPPWHGSPSVETLVATARDGSPPLAATLDDELRGILARALSRDPEARGTVDALWRALEDWLAHRAAHRVAARATAETERLRAALARDDVEEARAALGVLRFAWRQVLEAWPEHPSAARALDDAQVAVARWHLARREPAAADLVLSEVRAVPPDLRAAVDRARDELLRMTARQRDAEDVTTGRGARLFVTGLVSLTWVVGPLVTWGGGALERSRYDLFVPINLGLTGLGIAMAWIWRRPLSQTRVNRQVQVLVVVAPTVFLLAMLGGWLLGLDARVSHALPLVAYAGMGGMLVAEEPKRWLGPTVAYTVAFLLSAANLEWTPLWMAAANAILAKTLFKIGASCALADRVRSAEPAARIAGA